MAVPDLDWQVNAISWLFVWLAAGAATREVLARREYDRRRR